MPNLQVRRGSTAKLDRIDGELRVGNRARIESGGVGKLVVVSQGAYFEGAAEIDCNFECESLRVEHGGTLKVNGDLTVHKLLDVIHSVNSSGSIKAGEIDVGGRIYAKSIQCEGRIRVGGTLDVQQALEAKSVNVGGRSRAGGSVNLQNLDVGGVAEVGGGTILGEIRVGGRFAATSPLELGDMKVLGRISLPAGCKARKISSFGRLTTAGDLDCNEIEVEGYMEIRGNCKSEKIDTSGTLNVNGSLDVSGDLNTLGSTEVNGEFKSANIRIAGRFKASKAIVGNEIELGGEAETREGMKGNIVLVRSGSRCRGAIIGSKVDVGKSYAVVSNWSKKWAGQTASLRLIGKETRVEDIYATEVHLGRASRCGRVFAQEVEFEEACIAEKIEYTKELRGQVKSAFFLNPTTKVERLPNPPL
ncbi:MAG TPA: hypothetical protein VFF30_16520 [Nitrososphaerales archaeon]|nr:hypothetical protein [Nitrososphaerales archaeon]